MQRWVHLGTMRKQPAKSFPAILRNLRTANNLSIRKAATMFKISPSLLQRYESGDVIPGMTNMERIADSLGVSVDTLIGRRGAA
jgi:transcriptional regulator with XRE-family HTH domain